MRGHKLCCVLELPVILWCQDSYLLPFTDYFPVIVCAKQFVIRMPYVVGWAGGLADGWSAQRQTMCAQ